MQILVWHTKTKPGKSFIPLSTMSNLPRAITSRIMLAAISAALTDAATKLTKLIPVDPLVQPVTIVVAMADVVDKRRLIIEERQEKTTMDATRAPLLIT